METLITLMLLALMMVGSWSLGWWLSDVVVRLESRYTSWRTRTKNQL